jgi:hypothetical protein
METHNRAVVHLNEFTSSQPQSLMTFICSDLAFIMKKLIPYVFSKIARAEDHPMKGLHLHTHTKHVIILRVGLQAVPTFEGSKTPLPLCWNPIRSILIQRSLPNRVR